MPDSGNMPEPDAREPADLLQLALPISQKVVLVIDLVESVRLMAANEAGTVARWHDFAQTAQNHTIPAHHGRLVKSLGDGLMVEFENPRDAANAAHTLHAVMQKGNAGQTADRQMHLRAGINATHVYTDNNDIYGAGVNLAARIATLAGPGETVVTAQVRDGLTDGLDATIEDLGECYLKHIDEPVRAYRVGAAGQAPVVVAQREYATPLQPTIAVIPFTSRSNEPEHFAIGELIADGVIGQLSRTAELKVISRLSTTGFARRHVTTHEIRSRLGSTYVLSGSHLVNDGTLIVSAELSDARTNEVIWADRFSVPITDLFLPNGELIGNIVHQCHAQVMNTEVRRVVTLPLPTLESGTLLLGAITLMHRLSKQDFFKAQAILDHLVIRHPRLVAPKAWLGRWHNLSVGQGWSPNAASDTTKSLALIQEALDYEPANALALSVKALVHGYAQKRFDLAHANYQAAIDSNPNESLAWIGLSTLNTWQGKSELAVNAAEKALSLSPLDPIRYYFDACTAAAMLSAERYQDAIFYANRSILKNRAHSATYKTLTEAYVLSGDVPKARQTAKELMRIEPNFSVERFKNTSPMFRAPAGTTYAAALQEAGIPIQ